MPRKTRKAKEKARQRRLSPAAPDIAGMESVKGEFEFSFSPQKLASNKNSRQERHDKSIRLDGVGTTRRDLLKTVVLASIIFGLEFVIYSSWFR